MSGLLITTLPTLPTITTSLHPLHRRSQVLSFYTKQQSSYRIIQGGVYRAVKEITDVVPAQRHQGVRLTVIYTVTGVHGT